MLREAVSTRIKLRDIPFLSSLSLREIEYIKSFIKEETFPKGTMLHWEGDECRRILIVRSGCIKIFKTSSSGREQIIDMLEPGDTCACNPGSSVWYCGTSAQALTECRIWLFQRYQYVQLIQNNSKISRALNQLFAEKICRLCSFVEDVSLNNTRKKLIKFLVDIHENNVPQSRKGSVFTLPFTREEIAQRIGTTRETVTRHLSRLKHARFIDIESKEIKIFNLKKLRDLLS